jgi:hypothetical protein
MKYRYSLILLILLIQALGAIGQSVYQVRGVVADSAGGALPGATVRISLQRDTLTSISQKDGGFVLKGLKEPSFKILVSVVGYQPAERWIMAGNQRTVTLDTFRLVKDYHSLDTVIVTSVAPIVLKGDTIEYRAAAYKAQEGDMVEDLVKKFPGLTVDNTGQITSQGKKIAKVTVNGKDFFGDDILTATQNLPADIVKNVQVIQDYGTESKLTGIKSGQPITILNINTLDDKSAGRFGQATVGAGSDGRYQGNVFANKFNREQRLGVTGSANNINTGAGISNQQSAGINYGDRWSDKLAGNGNYGYSHSSSTSTGNSVQQSFFPGASTVNDNTNGSDNQSASHNLNYTFQYNPDKFNALSLNTRFSYSGSHSTTVNDFTIEQSDSLNKRTSTGHSSSQMNSQSPNLGVSLVFVHNFKKVGRVLSVNTSFDNNWSSQDNNTLNKTNVIVNDSPAVYTPLHQYITNDNTVKNTNIRATYVEPISKTMRILFNGGFTNNRNTSQRRTYAIDNASGASTLVDTLSDLYNYSQTTRLAGVGLNGNSKRLDYNLEFSAQPVILSGNSISKNFVISYRTFTIIPSVNLTYRFGKTLSVNLNYGAGSGMPDLAQLRPVTDLSNPQYPVTGNPNLKPSYTHNFSLGLNKTNMRSGDFFSFNLSVNETQNSIVANVINSPFTVSPAAGTGIQETRYLNTSGVYSLNSSYNYSKPFLDRKLVASLGGGLGYNNNISFTNSIRSINANWAWNQGAQLMINLPERMDLSLNANYSSNKTDYNTGSQVNTTINSFHLGLNGRNYFLHHYLFSYDFNKTYNSGYSGGVNNNPTVINVFLERWLLRNKMISLKLQCYNLLDQNTTISRSISGNIITDSRINQVGRYFMLTGNIRLSEFSGSKKK